MGWENRTVRERVDIKINRIGDFTDDYLDGTLYVNRRYQRKLVWGISDKKKLIDSILMGIPLPAFYFVTYDVPDLGLEDIFEVVDGVQRIDAIVSFMLGKFGVKYNGKVCYFDPYAHNSTMALALNNDKRLIRHDEESYLPKDVCREFQKTQMVTIITGADDAKVELIFSRLNSTGRKISSHDLRQSSAIGEFPDLVRRIASDIRLDYTYNDSICFSDMQKISVGDKADGYGVDVNTVFWSRHDLIRPQNLKESKDEEIIETLLAKYLLKDFKKSKVSLDDLYTSGTKLNTKIEQKVAELGKSNLEDQFRRTFDVIDTMFISVGSDFSSFLFDSKVTSNKDECFSILFLAIHRLLCEGYVVGNNHTILDAITESKDILLEFTKHDYVDYGKFDKAVGIIYKILQPAFSYCVEREVSSVEKLIVERLSYSTIEQQMIEFKIGITDFETGEVNDNVIHDIAKTLVAMSNNVNAKEQGLVVVGIADNLQQFNNWSKQYTGVPVIVNQHFVPGIDDEAERKWGSIDAYSRYFANRIAAEDISEPLKQFIMDSFVVITFYSRTLLVFMSSDQGTTSYYNGHKYVRQGNSTVCVDGNINNSNAIKTQTVNGPIHAF